MEYPTDTDIDAILKKLNGADLYSPSSELYQTMTNVKTEDMSRALELTKLAEDDLKSSKLLYENKLYALSVYHMQQAVEKTAKAYALMFGIITGDKLKEIGHESPLVFINMLKQSWVAAFLVALKKTNPNVKDNPNELLDIVDSKEKTLEMARNPSDQILIMLNQIDLIKEAFTGDPSMADFMNQYLSAFNIPNEVYSSIYSFIYLFILAFVTYPHETFTRYEDGEIKPKDYKPGFGIVDATPKIIEKMEEIIPTTEKFISLVLKKRLGDNSPAQP